MADWRNRAEVYGDVVFFNYYKKDFSQIEGEVYVWDLDKTYLDTRFHTARELVKTVFEKPFQKKNIPGTSTLVNCLLDQTGVKRGLDFLPIFFITASPPQLEAQIREKLALDNIIPLGIFCKDNLKNVSIKRWRRLTQQVGFKTQALLHLRAQLGTEVSQVFWGDDSESDAVIYSIYSDICSRRCDEEQFLRILKHFQVSREQALTILDLQSKIPSSDPVEKVYINLAVDTDAEYYLQFGRRTVPTRNYFQVALDLFQDGRLSSDHVLKVATDLTENYGFSIDELELSLDDLVRRQVFCAQALSHIAPTLQEASLLAPDFTPSIPAPEAIGEVGERVFELEGVHEPWVPETIDYFHDYR